MSEDKELRNKIDKTYEKTKARMRERYHLARELGLDSYQAAKVQGWSERRIRALVEGKD